MVAKRWTLRLIRFVKLLFVEFKCLVARFVQYLREQKSLRLEWLVFVHDFCMNTYNNNNKNEF